MWQNQVLVKWLLHSIQMLYKYFLYLYRMDVIYEFLFRYQEERAMAQTSFDVDEKTSEALEHLKRVYGVPTNAGVIKRALAIALAASRFADSDHNIHIRSEAPNGVPRDVILPQRLY